MSRLVPFAHLNHIDGPENLADLATRGVSRGVDQFKPLVERTSFLSQDSEYSFSQPLLIDPSECLERRKHAFQIMKRPNIEFDLILNSSKLFHLILVLCLG